MKLTLFKFAYHNVTRDFKTYLYHFLSCVFSVFIFFLFTTLGKHPALTMVENKSSIGIVLLLANLMTLLFSFVLIFYSLGNFLKNRSKQFAVLTIMGINKSQFNKLIFFENGILSVFALGLGIILGMLFSKLFLMMAQKMIGGLELYFYFPLQALLLTLLLMGGLFLVISFLAPVILRKKKVIELLKKEEVEEKNHFVAVSIFTAVMVLLTVFLSFLIGEEVLIYPFYLISYVSVSCFIFYLIFTLYEKVIKHSGKIYQKNNLIKITNFKYKINTNIKTMAGAMILLSVILTAFVYIVGAPRNVREDTKKIMPYSYLYAAWDQSIAADKKAELIQEELKDKAGFKSFVISYGGLKDEEEMNREVFLSNAMYNQVAKFLGREPLNLRDNEYFLVGVDGKDEPHLNEKVKKQLSHYEIKKEKGKEKRLLTLSGYFQSATVISDKKYEEMSKDLRKEKLYAFDEKDFSNNQGELEHLKEVIDFKEGKESLASAYWYYSGENLTRRLVSYVGSILCVSFLIGIASILYTRLYSLVEEESKRYRIMRQIGLSKKDLKKVLSSTIYWIFVVPFIVAIIVSWFFIILLNQMTLTSYLGLAVICSGIYLIVEGSLFAIIQRKYQKKVLKSSK